MTRRRTCGGFLRRRGSTYRLLSEAEWEYAARAGTTSPFHFGSTITTYQANYNGDYTYGGGSKGVYRGKTVPAGSFPANAFGLHDAHGNVWEWVADCWNSNYAGAPSRRERVDGRRLREPRFARRFLLQSSRGFLRSAFSATGSGQEDRYNDSGFRVARTLTP